MIKILHILYSLNIGGMENGIVNIVNNSDQTLFEHHLCCLKTSGDSAKKLNFSVPIYELNQKPKHDWSIPPKIVRLIRNVRPDIVHTRNWGALDGVAASVLTGTTVIHGEHGWNTDDLLGRNKKRRIIRKLFSSFISQYTTVSEDIRRWLIEYIGVAENKVIKIYNGVDTNKFFERRLPALRSKHGLENKVVIGSVGRLSSIKQHDLLIDAFNRIDHSKFDAALVIIGEGPERSRLESIIADSPYSDRIQLLGERADVHKLYSLIDIFALVSMNEGVSNTILEAMACGLPVIATNVGGNKELVAPEKTGYLIPNNVTCLRQTIEKYLENPELRQMHGKNGRRHVIDNFSLQKMVDGYSMIYQTVYDKKKKKLRPFRN